MLARTAKVVSCEHDYVELCLDQTTSCRACAGTPGCGIGPLLSTWQTKPGTWRLSLPPGGPAPRPGESVTLTLPPAVLLRAAAIAYLLPLAFGFGGAWLVGALALPAAADAWAAAGALGGLGLALPMGGRMARALATPRLLMTRGSGAGTA